MWCWRHQIIVSAFHLLVCSTSLPAWSKKSCLFLYIDAQFSLWTASLPEMVLVCWLAFLWTGFMPHHSINGYGMIMKLKTRPMQFCTLLHVAVVNTSAEWWWMKIFMKGVYFLSQTTSEVAGTMYLLLYTTETITDANKLDSNCIWQKDIIGEKTACQLQL